MKLARLIRTDHNAGMAADTPRQDDSEQTPRRQILATVLLFHVPFVVTAASALVGFVYTRFGKTDVANGICGPLAVLSMGVTFFGASLAAFLYGSMPLVDSPSTGIERIGKIALTCLPPTIGLVLMAVGGWLLLR